MIIGALLALAAAALFWRASARPEAVVAASAALSPDTGETAARAVNPAWIPVALAIGSGVLVLGISTSAGGVIVAAGVATGVYVLLRRARRRTTRSSAEQRDLAALLMVASLLLRAGAPPVKSAAAAARVSPSSAAKDLGALGRAVDMGLRESVAWTQLGSNDLLRPMARSALRSARSGAALADAWTAYAGQLRAEARINATVRVQRVGIKVLAPLGLCFLPSFVCLGVVPIVVGLAGGLIA